MRRWPLAASTLVLGFIAGSFLLGSWSRGQNQEPKPGPALPRELTSYRDVVKKVLPAVVSITARARPKAKLDQPSASFGPPPNDFNVTAIYLDG